MGPGQAIDSVTAHAFEVPADGPDGREQDGTLEWSFQVLPSFAVRKAIGGHAELFTDANGALCPASDRPGPGLEVKWADAEPYRAHGPTVHHEPRWRAVPPPPRPHAA